MNSNKVIKPIFKYLEIVASVLVPVAAAIMLVVSDYSDGISSERMLKIILTIVCMLAILIVLHRFVTLREIDEKTQAIAESVAQISQSPDLLRSIQESGVMNFYPRADERRMADIIEEIEESHGRLFIAGVALPSMVSNSEFRKAVLERSVTTDVRILLLNPDSKEADRRADIERSLGRATIEHIRGTMHWIQEQQVNNYRFRVHLYDLPPMLSLIITQQFVFVEPYHFGKIPEVEGCIGGKVPMMKIMNRPDREIDNAYAYFLAHFDYLWEITRGRRVNLPINLIETVPSRFVKLENKTGYDIDLADWKFTAQESIEPYQFEEGDFWKNGEKIIISQEEKDTHRGKIFRADGDFMGNNSILRLTNANGIMVGEWSIPLAGGEV